MPSLVVRLLSLFDFSLQFDGFNSVYSGDKLPESIPKLYCGALQKKHGRFRVHPELGERVPPGVNVQELGHITIQRLGQETMEGGDRALFGN